jgi:hypothetical protein
VDRPDEREQAEEIFWLIAILPAVGIAVWCVFSA